MPRKAPQQLRHERGRALLEEAGLGAPERLDPSVVWNDVEAVFAEHDRRRATAGAALADLEFLTEVVSAARKLHDVLARGASIQRRGAHDALVVRLKGGGDASAAGCTTLHSPEGLLALVAAARAAAHDLKGRQAPEPGLSERQIEVENGWLLAEALPEVFSRHTGLGAELVPGGEEQSASTTCMRFLKAAFELSGRELLTDADVLTTTMRWRRAQQVNEQGGQGFQDPAIAHYATAGDRLACGQASQDRIIKKWPGIGRLFNRAPGKPRLGVME